MAHINAEPFLVHREDFVNQFRVQFTDEYGRHCDHIFQVGEPVFYSHEGVMGYTTIKEISVSGIFTVYAASHVMLPTALGQKYVQKLDVDKVWSLLSAGKAPPNEDFLWEKWAHHRWMMQTLQCQSGNCSSHEIRRWKWDALCDEIENSGNSSNGYVLCRPCAETLELIPRKFATCPWRKKDESTAQTNEDKANAILLKYRHILHTRLSEALPGLPPTEQNAARDKIYTEVNADYLREYKDTSRISTV